MPDFVVTGETLRMDGRWGDPVLVMKGGEWRIKSEGDY
jgi:hypothetical protein